MSEVYDLEPLTNVTFDVDANLRYSEARSKEFLFRVDYNHLSPKLMTYGNYGKSVEWRQAELSSVLSDGYTRREISVDATMALRGPILHILNPYVLSRVRIRANVELRPVTGSMTIVWMAVATIVILLAVLVCATVITKNDRRPRRRIPERGARPKKKVKQGIKEPEKLFGGKEFGQLSDEEIFEVTFGRGIKEKEMGLQPSHSVVSASGILMCSVCLSEFLPSELIRMLPCHHVFHAECIDTWFGDHTNCPLCQTDYAPPPPEQTTDIREEPSTMEMAESPEDGTVEATATLGEDGEEPRGEAEDGMGEGREEEEELEEGWVAVSVVRSRTPANSHPPPAEA